MVDTVKISELTAVVTADGTSVLPVVQSGVTKKQTTTQTLIGAGGLTSQSLGIRIFYVLAATNGSYAAVYNNGSSGVGATLTNVGTFAAINVDGILPSVGQRVLIKNQLTPAENGIYIVTVAGNVSTAWILTRSTDYDQSSDLQQYDIILPSSGTVWGNKSLQQLTVGPYVMGTTPLVFSFQNIAANGHAVLTNNIFVATTGSDTGGVGDGTQKNPFATISNSLSTISSTSNENLYAINLAAGFYTESGSTLQFKPFESMIGTGSISTFFNKNLGDTDITFNTATWAATGGSANFEGFTLTSGTGVSVNLLAISAPTSYVTFKDFVITEGDFFYTGNGSTDVLIIDNCKFNTGESGELSIGELNLKCINSQFVNGLEFTSSHDNPSSIYVDNIYVTNLNNDRDAVITLSANGEGGNTIDALIVNSPQLGTINISGTGVLLSIDLISYVTPIYVNGATKDQVSIIGEVNAQNNIYVSSNGNDNDFGTFSLPYQTLLNFDTSISANPVGNAETPQSVIFEPGFYDYDTTATGGQYIIDINLSFIGNSSPDATMWRLKQGVTLGDGTFYNNEVIGHQSGEINFSNGTIGASFAFSFSISQVIINLSNVITQKQGSIENASESVNDVVLNINNVTSLPVYADSFFTFQGCVVNANNWTVLGGNWQLLAGSNTNSEMLTENCSFSGSEACVISGDCFGRFLTTTFYGGLTIDTTDVVVEMDKFTYESTTNLSTIIFTNGALPSQINIIDDPSGILSPVSLSVNTNRMPSTVVRTQVIATVQLECKTLQDAGINANVGGTVIANAYHNNLGAVTDTIQIPISFTVPKSTNYQLATTGSGSPTILSIYESSL